MNYQWKSLCLVLTALCFSLGISAQPPTRYVYDENGRLRAVIAPNGEAGVYDYDPAGNITAIRRLAADALEIIDFAARQGVPGNQVRIVGVGFGGNVSAVTFNGANARIISQSANLVVVEVPANATTGPISLTATRGTVTASLPFTIAGVIVLPSTVSLLPGQPFQFTAQIPGATNQSVRWFVNDTPGGTSQTGTISADGFYVAPNLSASLIEVTVSAESVALPGLRGQSQVIVTDKVYSALSGAVSVRYGNPPMTDKFYLARTEAVSIRYGNPPSTASAFVANVDAVSIRYGNPPATAAAYAPFADAVSIRYGNPSPTASAYATFTEALSVRYGAIPANANAFPTLTSVSITSSAVINSIAPLIVTKGIPVSVTITGTNLQGATGLRFFNEASGLDTNITATNISVNAGGTTLTATINATATAIVGKRVVIVTAPAGRSQTSNTGVNTIEIQ